MLEGVVGHDPEAGTAFDLDVDRVPREMIA
jgi:hypothetical protein